MIISRGVRLLKNLSTVSRQRVATNKIQVRNSGHEVFYRYIPDPSRAEIICAELVGGIMWWWVLWHLWHDWGHIVGEFPYPEPSEWTDQELGIPPDDYD
ncbi:NADH dehydrogenase [ubiquinone] 1 beta subcomplex subunit 2, mitochondrial-like [Microplitis mediator]|uniref:NADH dehydrogenase [ubiquinone] 1 beta subcomplex subunit 2, mitochondrial-like n=1 Tax=Microplitis mediator TaxID=375433 RepID=UPI0025546200|nr:NADH dehydrogenase [ubiquinone] 1 beta subcomplex subunit 2, mitochondrial-like [Microplitis mediator]